MTEMAWHPFHPILFIFLSNYISLCASAISAQIVGTPVDNEFIVTYRNRYLSDYRQFSIASILRLWYINHSILDRGYFSQHASDFDVVKIHNLTLTASDVFIKRFAERCSVIKHISPQKRLTRTLQTASVSSKGSVRNRKPKVFGKQWKSPASGTVPLHKSKQPWKLLEAEKIWSMNICGAGVRVGIFDTGLASTSAHPHFQRARIRERTDWTRANDQDSLLRAGLAIGPNIDQSGSVEDQSSDEAIDGHGHGTFVAGVIAATGPSRSSSYSLFQSLFSGHNPQTNSNSWTSCPPPGLAPQADLYIFRVFTDAQVSYTSWFLDAFNYAISRGLHVINLSVGGPDFLDQPFVDKVWELSSNGILLVSAIGNDGPLFGTLNNPADQMDVLGVGGVDATGRIARFSSRGMTTWALPYGYGQVKPDVVTFSTGVISSAIDGKCRTLSGTSVASPVVTGTVVLLIDAALQQNRAVASGKTADQIHSAQVPINPASVKQALIAGATQLSKVRVFGSKYNRWPETDVDQSSVFEQGAGLVDLVKSLLIMQRIKPQASLLPSYLDLTDCPYMWPYCSQPMYHGMQPIVINVTVLNSMDVVGWIKQPVIYHPFTQRNGHRLRVRFSYSKRLWPWAGYLAVHLDVESNTDEPVPSNRFSGIAEGVITLTVESSDPATGNTLSTDLTLPIRASIVPTPDRSRRILFDQFHSLRYPSGYIPRDDLTRKNQPLDWLGDHMHTNLRDLYIHLQKANYHVEILTLPYTCFNAKDYGTLLIIDPEEEFFPEEVDKLFIDVTQHGLSLIVFAEWYNTSLIDALRFYDTNTKRLWVPETGGSNLPALNDLLRPFGVELGDMVYAGQYAVGRRKVTYTSGSSFLRFPHQNISQIAGRGSLLRVPLVDLGSQILMQSPGYRAPVGESAAGATTNNAPHLDQPEVKWRLKTEVTDPRPPILGLWTPLATSVQTGRLVVYGDADCLTSTHLDENCFWLLDAALQFANSRFGRIPHPLADHVVSTFTYPLDPLAKHPSRPLGSSLYRISNVLQPDRAHTEVSGQLPREAYRHLPNCPVIPSSVIQPVDATVDENRITFEPQPLLLYSELPRFVPPKPYRFDQGCHSEPLPDLAAKSTNSRRAQLRFLSSDLLYLMRDSMYVYAVVFLILCLVYRRLIVTHRNPFACIYTLLVRNPRLQLFSKVRRRWHRWRNRTDNRYQYGISHQPLTELRNSCSSSDVS